MVTGVYMIINKTTDEVYVGSATDIYKRWSTHLVYLRQGTYKYKTLQDAFDNEEIGWEILEECLVSEKTEREEYWFDMVQKMDYILLNSHKKAGTHRVKDVSLMRLAQKGSNNPSARLTEQDVMEILYLKEQGYAPKEIAERYGVKKSHVSNIGIRKWVHITEKVKPAWFEDVI